MPTQNIRPRPNSYPAIDPGRLRHRVQILRQTSSIGAAGSEVAWEPLMVTYAGIEPAKARDIIRNGQNVSEVQVPITVRYRKAIEANMRVLWNEQTYIIQGILNPLERGVVMTLMCVALGANE